MVLAARDVLGPRAAPPLEQSVEPGVVRAQSPGQVLVLTPEPAEGHVPDAEEEVPVKVRKGADWLVFSLSVIA